MLETTNWCSGCNWTSVSNEITSIEHAPGCPTLAKYLRGEGGKWLCSGIQPPRVTNRIGELGQIEVFDGQGEFVDLRFSKFFNAARWVSSRLLGVIGWGDQVNILEDALAEAYLKGWADCAKLALAPKLEK